MNTGKIALCLKHKQRYLQAKIGKEKDYEAALHRLRGDTADISEEAVDIKVIELRCPNNFLYTSESLNGHRN